MATFPPYVKLGWRDHAEKPTPVVARSEMERGVARQRRTHADSLVTVPVTAYFDTAADSLAFESWFFGDVGGGAAWFDFTQPRTGAVTQARVVGGDIGQLKPATKNWAFSERTFQLEYIRLGFVQLPPGLHSVDPVRIVSVQRNSAATYVDDAGLLQTAPANVARWQGGQVLVEGEATNYCTSNNVTSPTKYTGLGGDGTIALLSDPFWPVVLRITKTTGGAGARVGIRWPVAAISDDEYTVGIWVRRPAAVIDGYAVYSDMTKVAGGVLSAVKGLPLVPPGVWFRSAATVSEGGASFSGGYMYSWVEGSIGDYIDVALPCAWSGASDSSAVVTGAIPATRAADIITVAA